MNRLSTFLAPFSYWVMAHRNTVIVVLGLVLLLTALHSLVARWRIQRLERDLGRAKSSRARPAEGRQYMASVPPVDERPQEAGGLPPVKGGRSYARNLGSALQKAGMGPGAGASQPIYSPPTPAGWAPSYQPGLAQPQPPQFSPPTMPWGAPAPPPPPSWPYAQPGGPASPNLNPPPLPRPYQPPPPAPQVQPGSPPPFYPPALAQPAQPLAAQRPTPFAGPPMNPVAPPVPAAAGPEPPPAEAPAGRKGKRRRFNLSVLESLEKIVQPRQAGPAPAPLPAPAPSVPTVAPVIEVAEPVAHVAEPVAQEAEPATREAEPPATSKPEPVISMRSMLFGEEPQTQDSTPAPHEPEAEQGELPVMSWASDREAARATAGSAAPEVETVPLEPAVEIDEPPVEPPGTTESLDALDQHAEEARQVESPAPEAADLDQPEPPITTEGARESTGSIVIIEDDPSAAQYYATLFQGNGYTVEIANDGVSGVDLCARVQPQVILLDVMMPRQNGILVLQTLRASDETRNTPVVVMSNFSEPTLIKRALQLGALEYVIKTQVEGPALLAAMPRWMNREKAFAA